ncbi:hypothetical protein [Anoxynatronum sibiricum]|uniref:Uncharacterized protein n=1 Tax=Anoxynatronum sibiricum TaxID=210623 RepID=A0ABU9VWH0_9CLOT
MTDQLKEKIRLRQPGILTYGITPPKAGQSEEKLHEIARRQVERIQGIDIDALIRSYLNDMNIHSTRKNHFI